MSGGDDYIHPIHIEVQQKLNSTKNVKVVSDVVRLYLLQSHKVVVVGKELAFDDCDLFNHIESISVDGFYPENTVVDLTNAAHNITLHIHVYQLNNELNGSIETLEDGGTPAITHWMLPSSNFKGLWDSLIYDIDIKKNLVNYVKASLILAEKNVDCNIVTCNKVVLLHGPPGTGKTSLCKALAHKLSIQLSDKFRYGVLVEINSHSLFSRWFSESGKLVLKMFARLQELIDDPNAIVFVLIDEVESLSASRKASSSTGEPGDAVRAVNALLTQLDTIRKYPNVIILTTSNVTEMIDIAFIDRADIKQLIGAPSQVAIYYILKSCIQELITRGIISEPGPVPLRGLNELAGLCLGFSGRTLRKLPFIALALFVRSSPCSYDIFKDALWMAIKKHINDTEELCLRKVDSFR